jgi:hypothetical protein
LVYRAHNEENRLAEEREGVEPGTPAEEGAVADQLWQRFQAEHPDLAADEAMVARAATRVAKRQGIADHAAFIRAVAAEVRAADAGRGHRHHPQGRHHGGAGGRRGTSQE